MFKVIDNNQDDKNEADMSSKGADNSNNLSVSKNQSSFVTQILVRMMERILDLENNKMVYNYTSYEVGNNSLHNGQQHTNNPNDVISSYQYGANSSQGASR